jgi:ABC-type branched-subunit amino acid transport system ATPase component
MEKGEIRFDGSVRALMNRPDIVQSVFLGNAVTAGSLTTAAERRLLDSAADVETVLQVDRIGLSYGGLRILNGVSVSVAREEVVGIVGPNGAGKTTLFDIVTGFVAPDEGTITYVGTDVTGMSPDARARLGLARSYQNVRLFPALTVRENIAVSLERHLRSRSAAAAALWLPPVRRSERRVKRRVDNLVESLGLGAFANKFVNELSTGSRRIVDIACLLAAAPRLLLLDEPSSGLAQAETEQLAPVIGRIVKETGCGVLIIEHDLGLVASVSDRLVAMRLGEVIAEGVPNEVLRDQEVVDVLLGGASEAVLNRSVSLAGRGQNP